MTFPTLPPRRLLLVPSLLLLIFMFIAPDARSQNPDAEPTFERVGTSVFRAGKVIKVMEASLYLANRADAAKVLSDVPKRLTFTYTRDIASKRFIDSANGALKDNCTAAELAAIKDRVEKLHGMYADVKKGDTYEYLYVPGKGTTLLVNKQVKGTIPGADFAKAYFSIWLGAKPVTEKLKRELLGG